MFITMKTQDEEAILKDEEYHQSSFFKKVLEYIFLVVHFLGFQSVT